MTREIKFRAWDGEKMIVWEMLDTWCNDYVRANKCPIMQYTGLKDKNGKEIYEGDIVKIPKYTKKGKYTVKYEEFYPGFIPFVEMENGYRETCEVIGNIYSDPHLLNPEK